MATAGKRNGGSQDGYQLSSSGMYFTAPTIRNIWPSSS
ncbi:hypothetical protein COLO4_31565 [Corchorus olitorius]|uniref:Uncharacterized protein n=1 Tax=Corchorus olitorius TaxID=93759 RepID=A0A1R3H432_9ROSI|nr:hypothetical protein COLO4_31565 [Corchorus olitorius]